ncbi:MAG: hypothetical protein ACYDH5_07855 [Acidimicrobiales bacterium]
MSTAPPATPLGAAGAKRRTPRPDPGPGTGTALHHARATATLVGFVASLAVVGWLAYDAIASGRLANLDRWWLAASLASGALYWVSLAIGWSVLTDAEARLETVAMWSRTQVLRYVPGGIWAPAARATTVTGRARRKFAAAGGEAFLQVSSAAVLGGIAYLASGDSLLGAALLLGGLGGGFTFARMAGRFSLTPASVTGSATWYGISRLAFGASVLTAQLAVAPVQDRTLVLAAACVAWVAGFAAVWAPGGIGVRELAYVGLAAAAGPSGALAAGALVARVSVTFAELLVLATAVPAAHVLRWSRGRGRGPLRRRAPRS